MRKEATVFNDGDGANGIACVCFFNGGSTHRLANSFPFPIRYRMNNGGKFVLTSFKLQMHNMCQCKCTICISIDFQCSALKLEKGTARTLHKRSDSYPVPQACF